MNIKFYCDTQAKIETMHCGSNNHKQNPEYFQGSEDDFMSALESATTLASDGDDSEFRKIAKILEKAHVLIQKKPLIDKYAREITQRQSKPQLEENTSMVPTASNSGGQLSMCLSQQSSDGIACTQGVEDCCEKYATAWEAGDNTDLSHQYSKILDDKPKSETYGQIKGVNTCKSNEHLNKCSVPYNSEVSVATSRACINSGKSVEECCDDIDYSEKSEFKSKELCIRNYVI